MVFNLHNFLLQNNTTLQQKLTKAGSVSVLLNCSRLAMIISDNCH